MPKVKVLLLLLLLPAVSLMAGTNRWSIHGPAGGDVPGLSFDPEVAGLVFAATDNGIFKSSDDGATWAAIPSLLGTPFNDVVAAPSDPNTLYASSVFGLFKSTDRGANWFTVHGFASFGLAVSRQNADVVYSVNGTVPMRSSDGGITFIRGTGIPSAGVLSVTQVVVDPANHDIVYASFLSAAGVYKSVDGGATWNQSSSGLTAAAYYSLAYEQTSATLYLGSMTGLFRSSDAAATWTRVTLPATVDNQPVYSLAAEGGRLFAGTSAGLLRRDAAAFARVGGVSSSIRTIGLTPLNTALVLISAGFELARSVDGGSTFAPANQGVLAMYTNAIATDANLPEVVYAGGPSGTFKSSDRGHTWSLTGPLSSYLAVDGVDSQTVYLISSGVFKRSIDAGSTWQDFRTGLAPGSAYGITVDPTTRGTIYTFLDGKVNKKVGDAPWTVITNSIPSVVSLSLVAVDPQN
jgi:hypothetical protein